MRIVQVGGGSMGARRMRDLHGRTVGGDVIEVRLVDTRADRRASALERFAIAGFATVDAAVADWAGRPDAFVISTPPDQHEALVRTAVELGIHVFCEADIWPLDPLPANSAAARTGLVAAPSATLMFHPMVREVTRIVAEELGRVHAFGYLLSVDAPSWHPGEGVEYYARHRATAPAREMTAFELIGLQAIFGHPAAVSGIVQRRGALSTDGEDSYSLQYRTVDGTAGQLTVVMAVPQVARRGWAAGEHGVVLFDLLSGVVERRLPGIGIDDSRTICDWAQVLESVYLDEISTFVRATRGEATWPYTYADSAVVCGALAAAERSAITGTMHAVAPGSAPAALPDGYCAAATTGA